MSIAMLSTLYWLAMNAPGTFKHPPLFEKQAVKGLRFESKLNSRIGHFKITKQTLVAIVLDLAYEFQLPTGIEYVDHDAMTRPINLELHNESVREILLAIVQQVPEYKISFSDRVVDIYAPKAREDSSNLLNKLIKNFAVSELDTVDADAELFCALSHEVTPSGGCGGSFARGQLGPLKISVHLQNAKVYEILNAMAAQNGKAIWTVIAPPDRLSKIPVGGLWHIYPLESGFRWDCRTAAINSRTRFRRASMRSTNRKSVSRSTHSGGTSPAIAHRVVSGKDSIRLNHGSNDSHPQTS